MSGGRRTIEKVKVVRIIARLNVGGPARHVVWLTKALQNNEFDSVLLAGTVPSGEEDMSYFAAENGVEPIYIEQMSRELSPKDIVSLWKIYRRLVREKPDIIHTHTAKAGTVGRAAGFAYRWLTWRILLGKPRHVKFVHTFHGHVFHSYYGAAKTRVFLFIERMLARFATDRIIVISRQQFDEIYGKFTVGSEKQFKIIPLGIDLQAFADWRAKKNILREEVNASDGEILVGLVGRLTEVKNHSLFLRAAKLYGGKTDAPPVKFLVVGDGHLRESLEKEVAELGIESSVIFLGNRDDADVFYAGLDIVALTSLNEGTPLSLIEAMANEKPVVSTAVGGVVDLLGEITERNDNFQICERGMAVASGDAEGLCSGLSCLVGDAELRRRLGTAGKAFVETRYGKTRLIGDVESLYREVIEN